MNTKQFNKVDSFLNKEDGSKMSHKEFYSNIINAIGLKRIIPLIPVKNKEVLKDKLEQNQYLNNIPLIQWDIASHGVSRLFLSIGINVFSLSECVCLLKEAAIMWAEQNEEEINK